jgi:hypothetical protein
VHFVVPWVAVNDIVHAGRLLCIFDEILSESSGIASTGKIEAKFFLNQEYLTNIFNTFPIIFTLSFSLMPFKVK